MFDKLVLSTKEKRQARASKFVVATSFVYMLALASALVFSVVSANPGIFEASDIVRLTAVPPPPIAPTQPITPSRRQENTPKESIYNVKDLEKLDSQPIKKPQVIPQGLAREGNLNGIPGDPHSGIQGGLLPTDTHEVEPPPLPPQPNKVKVDPPQPAPEKQMIKLPSQVLTGKAIVRKAPEYPPMAKQIRLAGSVSVEIIISADGRVESARALNGHPLLMKASVEAARGWQFQPTMLNGVPVRVTGIITFNFTLN